MHRLQAIFLLQILGCGDNSKTVSADGGKPVTGEDTSENVLDADDSGRDDDTGHDAHDDGADTGGDTGNDSDGDTGGDTGDPEPESFTLDWPDGTDPFADSVVDFDPGPDAGFGSDDFPDVVLGPPRGRGAAAGSLHVLSLGELGSITLEMVDLEIIDGPGPDLLVFENPFPGWYETGVVEASLDGIDWYAWPCAAEDEAGDFPGCAGRASVYATPDFLIDPTDPEAAGGDAFDLADIGLPAARFVRITDSGYNALGYGGITGGFDLDAIAAANWAEVAAD